MNLVSPALIALRIFGWIWTEAWPEIASKWLSRRDLVQQSIKIIVEIVVNMSIVARIKFSNRLKVSTSAVGYYSYTKRCRSLKCEP